MTEEQAKQRLLILTAVKLLAAGFIICGLVNIMKPTYLVADANMGRIIGVALAFAGLLDLLIVPYLLKKAWGNQDRK